MSEISTKFFHEIPLKQRGYEVSQQPVMPESVDKARQSIGESNASGAHSDDRQRDRGGNGQGGEQAYSVVITHCRSGKIRAVNMKAGSMEAAKAAAKAVVKDGEDVTGVRLNPAQPPSFGKRGIIA